MKLRILLIGIAWGMGALNGYAQFDCYFGSKTLRLDYYHCGDKASEEYYFDELSEEPYWGGSRVNLIDTTFYGNYYVKVYDQASGRLIYSRGYNTLFGEWRTVPEAEKIRRCCSETVVMPFPKADVRVELWSRNKQGILEKQFTYAVDVKSYFIRKDQRLVFPVEEIQVAADPAQALDIVLLPEGYTTEELDRFREDCRKFAEGLFLFSPYRENRDKFNIRAVLAPSAESGADIPGAGVWKRTVLNSSFYTFDTERYIMTYDNKSLRDLAANAPYDFIYVLANTDKYGGGAIYNHYGLSVAGNALYAKIYVHEFGHLFAGLGDEYVGGAAYSDIYPADIEPWEANLTTLVHFEQKWKDLVDVHTPVPTPVDPAALERVGAYEGGGYLSKGIYRSRPFCLMNSFEVDDFCPACFRAIEKQIRFYSE